LPDLWPGVRWAESAWAVLVGGYMRVVSFCLGAMCLLCGAFNGFARVEAIVFLEGGYIGGRRCSVGVEWWFVGGMAVNCLVRSFWRGVWLIRVLRLSVRLRVVGRPFCFAGCGLHD